MRAALWLVMLLVLVAALLGQSGDARSAAPNTGGPPVPQVRFLTVDVFVDAGATGLGAWQVEVTPRRRTGETVVLVGIEGGEGGEHAAYAKPAYYDPAALAPEGGGRVILAAYSTAKDLPTGRTRVARLHVMVEGRGAESGKGEEVEFKVDLRVAADAQGRAIEGAGATAATVTDTSNGDDR